MRGTPSITMIGERTSDGVYGEGRGKNLRRNYSDNLASRKARRQMQRVRVFLAQHKEEKNGGEIQPQQHTLLGLRNTEDEAWMGILGTVVTGLKRLDGEGKSRWLNIGGLFRWR